MEIIKDIKTLREQIEKIERIENQLNDDSMKKFSIGLVHTKGPLHEGHRQLIQAARKENYLVVVSNILVPREFNNIESYELYPRTTEEDKSLASLAGADFFFEPELEEFEGRNQWIGVKLNEALKDELNGQDRPGYYEEKLTTLIKMLNIIQPTKLYMSDKDLQQVYFTDMLLKQLQYDCELKVLPVVRDEDNMPLGVKAEVLKADERKQLIEFYKVFAKAQNAYTRGMVSSRRIKWHVENEMGKLYLCQLRFAEVLEPERLRKIETITDEAILMIGISVGRLRICDYIRLEKE